MAIISFPSFRKDRSSFHQGDWSQQEIADFYRAQRLLAQNGAAIGIDRGLSDENDPWIVFYDMISQDVFLHIARIDNLCQLFCEPLDLKLSAADVSGLIVRFEEEVKQYLSITSERNRNVITHPAARIIMSISAVFLLFKLESNEAKAQTMDRTGGLEENGGKSGEKAQPLAMRAHNAFSRIFEQVDSPANIAMLASMALIGELAQKDLSMPDLKELAQSGAIEDSSDSFDATILVDTGDNKIGHDTELHIQGQHDFLLKAAHQNDISNDIQTGASSDIESLLALIAHAQLNEVLNEDKSAVPLSNLVPTEVSKQGYVATFQDLKDSSEKPEGSETTDSENTILTGGILLNDGDSEQELSGETIDMIKDIFGISYDELLAADENSQSDGTETVEISETLDQVSLALLDQIDDKVELVFETAYYGDPYLRVMEHMFTYMGSYNYDYQTGHLLIEETDIIGKSYDDIGIWTNTNRDGSTFTIIGSMDLIDEVVMLLG